MSLYSSFFFILARTLLFCQCQIMQLLIKKYKNYGKDYWN